ncbi:leucine-rich repeat extensin-like protein 7 [Actinidia eriantha]|uniref:leucine-rich repeat extensin-like protein 7 n=1 Tax=Actinidia eriantha TaxID=165200 RepID=UPI00258BE014|nr:leucine-rich repeat extensin-like protein 7 [Actinidia eriantha]
MKTTWLLASLSLLQVIATQAATSSEGIGIGIGGGGVGVWIGGGPNPNPNPNPPVSKLQRAYSALQTWKSAIKEDPLMVLESWVGTNVCAYKGVYCVDPKEGLGDPNGPVIAGIDLNNGNLQGTLVKELSLLTDLSLLHLNSNRFTGLIPLSLKDLPSLIELDLSNNGFSGPFPTQCLLIPNLIYLDLRFNNFYGPIPEDLFNKRLDAIFLNNNQFSGQIPPNMGNSPASVINLANNRFSGDIPFSFGTIGPRLKEILFINNQLTGCIPEGIGLWQDLQVLDVSFNSLMGQLPNSLSCLTEIEVLNLGHNKLSGSFPDVICSLRTLVNLSVANNFFSGLSQDCSSKRYGGFDFSVNCIPGLNGQRPEPECSLVPGGGLNCLRLPGARPLVCGLLVETHNQKQETARPPKNPYP